MSNFKAKLQQKQRKGRGREEKKRKGETRHTNPSLLPAPLLETILHGSKYPRAILT